MMNDKLLPIYHAALGAYEAAKAGSGCRVETFTKLVMAERILTAHSGWADEDLELFRERYSP
jgi:hypothetical protein